MEVLLPSVSLLYPGLLKSTLAKLPLESLFFCETLGNVLTGDKNTHGNWKAELRNSPLLRYRENPL
jgi:hypothetical protein